MFEPSFARVDAYGLLFGEFLMLMYALSATAPLADKIWLSFKVHRARAANLHFCCISDLSGDYTSFRGVNCAHSRTFSPSLFSDSCFLILLPRASYPTYISLN